MKQKQLKKIKTKKNLKSLQTILIVTFCFLLVNFNSKAQNNALALNGAYIVMNGGTETENIKLVIDQSSTSGIVRLAGGGHIHSENQYNGVKWLTNNELGNYVFPFGLGDQLKTSTWGGNNSSGFTALPGGDRFTNGSFYAEGSYGYWWSATESGTAAWRRLLNSSQSDVYRYTYDKGYGLSVSCIKD